MAAAVVRNGTLRVGVGSVVAAPPFFVFGMLLHRFAVQRAERGPDGDVETLEFFTKRVGDLSKIREDVKTWFDLLDLDDHVTFGGPA